MKLIKSITTLAFLITFAAVAQAQTYPNKPIRLVVAFAPGGGTDLLARLVSQRLSEVMGQPVIVENRAGAGGNIGTRAVAAAKPDGHTILVTSNAYLVNPAISKTAGYDPLRDLIPIISAGKVPSVIVVHPSMQVGSFKELMTQSLSQPVFYSSAGVGTIPYIFIEYLNKRAGSKFVHVPYSGSGPALSAIVSGHVTMAALAGETGGLKDFIQTGKFRPLLVTSSKRWAARPEILSLSELGLADFVMSSWVGFLVPANTPKDVVSRLNYELGRILSHPEVRALQSGRDYEPNTSEQFAASNRIELERWINIAKEMDYKAE